MHCTTCRQTIVCSTHDGGQSDSFKARSMDDDETHRCSWCIALFQAETNFMRLLDRHPAETRVGRSVGRSVGWYIGSSCRNFCLCLLLWFLRGLRVHQRSQVPESEQSRPQLMPTVTQSRPDAMDAGWLFDRSSDAPASGHFSRRKPENQ